MPVVSVIMPVFNGERFLSEAIESILAQTFTDFEFIIIDDGSEDGTADIILDYQKQDARIQLIQHEKNEGVAKARNQGIRAAQGEYIAAMDCDDISLPERLRLQVAYLEAKPEIGAVGVGAQMVHEDLSPLRVFRLKDRHALIALDMVAGGDAVVRGALMMRRVFLRSSGGYNPDRDLDVTNDAELTLRLLHDAGIKFGNVMDILYIYRRHELSLTLSNLDQNTWPLQRRALERLWGEAKSDTMQRFRNANLGSKLSWRDRRLARRDYSRLIDAMLDARWIEPGDVDCLRSEINRRLETTTPRLWQMFLHWWRHNITRKQ